MSDYNNLLKQITVAVNDFKRKEQEEMRKKDAYKIVFFDLINNRMTVGHYDAEHGKKEFMFGVLAVMEIIARKISEPLADEFLNIFFENMIQSGVFEKEGAKNGTS